MRSNLMAAMGLGKMQGSQSAERRSTRSAANHSELFDNTESSVPFIDILGAARASATQQNATQDNQLAPSPKRARGGVAADDDDDDEVVVSRTKRRRVVDDDEDEE